MLNITNYPKVGEFVVGWKHMCAQNEVTSGQGLAMDNRP